MNEMSKQQEETMNAGLSVAERDLLRAKLRDLPDTMPPRVVWQRIEEQAKAEGLLSGLRSLRPMRWLTGTAVAAAVALAVLRVPDSQLPEEEPVQFSDTPEYAALAANNGVADLNALMVQSQQLERDLRALPGQPRVVKASTAAAISQLEARIAAIDYRLTHPNLRLTQREAAIYWRERVRLMNLLVNLRYAQAQRVSF